MISLPINDQLSQLQSWQQSVFCMALAEHTLLHFHLFCEASENIEDGKSLDNINQLFWEKMTTKGAKINFTIQQEHFETIVPDARDFDFYGVYPAIECCVIMSCAFNSFLIKSNEEALNASQTSFATIASFIELKNDSEVNENTLKQDPLFQNELQFQIDLLEKLNNQRSPELIKSIRQFVADYGTTNIGITLND